MTQATANNGHDEFIVPRTDAEREAEALATTVENCDMFRERCAELEAQVRAMRSAALALPDLEVVGYLRASSDGRPQWEEDCICQDAIYPNFDGDESVSMAVCRAADAQALIEQCKYKAELYDEVWAKATGMGFMNVTMALEAVTAQQPAAVDASGLVEVLELIVKQYPNPDFTHEQYRVNACRSAEAALETYRAALAGGAQ